MSNRENIAADVKRRVLVEAGHRCAIPTCRHPTTEIAHIVPYAKSKDNSFENLIALCPNDHTRYDQKREIDLASVRMYKANLGLLNGRYNDVERSIIEFFARKPPLVDADRYFMLGTGADMQLANAIADGIVEQMQYQGVEVAMLGPNGKATRLFSVTLLFHVTDAGLQLIERFRSGAEIS